MAYDLGPSNIRVNAVSAGPLRTLAARGVKDFNSVLSIVEERSPMRRGVDASEVADTALFLMSSLSRGVTGKVAMLMVDTTLWECRYYFRRVFVLNFL